MPIGVTGPESPVSTITSIDRAEMPFTSAFLKRSSYGMWSSNHLAFAAIDLISSAFFGSS